MRSTTCSRMSRLWTALSSGNTLPPPSTHYKIMLHLHLHSFDYYCKNAGTLIWLRRWSFRTCSLRLCWPWRALRRARKAEALTPAKITLTGALIPPPCTWNKKHKLQDLNLAINRWLNLLVWWWMMELTTTIIIIIIPHNRDDAKWMKHTLGWMDMNTGKVQLDYRPVHTQPLPDGEMPYVAPVKRQY